MTRQRLSILILRLVLVAVLVGQSLALALSERAIAAFANTGLPNGLRLVLAWGEVAAAILFLLPATSAWGGWCLFAVLLAAVGLHVGLGQSPGALIVYMAAVAVVQAHRESRTA